MPLNLFDIQTPLTVSSVRDVLVRLLTCAGFPVDSWQDESAARAFLEAAAAVGAEQSKPVAEMAKMGFLDTSVDTFLTAKVASDFQDTRQVAVPAALSFRIVNSSGSTYTPGAQAFIVSAANGQTYTNLLAASIAPGTSAKTLTAQVGGSAGNIVPQELSLVTPLAGVRCFFDGTIVSAGADAEIDSALVSRARTKWATLRTEKIAAGIENLIRNAVPALRGVALNDNNPRGPGTLDVYLAADTATAGVSDVATVQVALDGALFGTGTAVHAGLAIAAPTILFDLAGTIYVTGLAADAAITAVSAAWDAFLLTVPVGGFDLTPGPANVVLSAQITDALGAMPGVTAVQLSAPAGLSTSIPAFTKVLRGAFSFNVVSLTS